MVVRVAQPHQRCDENFVLQRVANSPDDFPQQHAIGENGKMLPMLFESGDRDDDWKIARQLVDLGPGQIGQIHAELSGDWRVGAAGNSASSFDEASRHPASTRIKFFRHDRRIAGNWPIETDTGHRNLRSLDNDHLFSARVADYGALDAEV